MAEEMCDVYHVSCMDASLRRRARRRKRRFRKLQVASTTGSQECTGITVLPGILLPFFLSPNAMQPDVLVYLFCHGRE